MKENRQPGGTATLSRHEIRAGEYSRMDLPGAHQVLPMVRAITRQAVAELRPLQQCLNNMVPADPRNTQVNVAYSRVVEIWVGKIERLGLKVFGLWQVGFDGGSGWYGWQYPERRIRYFMEYDAGFSDRCLINDRAFLQDSVRYLNEDFS